MSGEGNSSADKSGKRVGFASNLTTFDPQSQSPPSPGSQVWDNETDHLLSYFLGGDFGSNGTIPEFGSTEQGPNQESAGSPLHFAEPKSDGNLKSSAFDRERGTNISSRGRESKVFPRQRSKFGSIPQHGTGAQDDARKFASGFDDDSMQPPTPKVPQYHGRPPGRIAKQASDPASKIAGNVKSTPPVDSTSQNAVPSSASSSSSSLSTMANTLVSGGPLLYQQMQQQQQHHQNQNHRLYAMNMAAFQQQQQGVPSPVSPAAMIGTPETMLLPPPPSAGIHPQGSAYQSAAVEAGGHQYPPPHPTANAATQQQHLAWLQQLNEMAKASQQPQHNPHPQTHHMTHSGQMLPPPTMSVQPNATSQQPHPYMYSPFPHLTFYGPAAAAAAAALQSTNNPAPEESEEKRAKRLERNRESARKSRRRKKERLLAMEGKANAMHKKIAKERQRQIELLVPGLRQWRVRQLENMVDSRTSQNPPPDRARIMTCIRETGPFSPIFQAVLEFQANSLHTYMLPRYQKLWLWFAMQQEGYFSAGKEEYIKRDPDRLIVRTSSGKISSKQVGDEITNGSGGKRPARSKGSVDDNPRTSRVNDAARMWPFLCYEHQFSVDQEEKFLALHKKLHAKHSISDFWKKSRSATQAANSLRVAMESVCQVASQREERTLVGVLTTDQIARYRQWVVMNHERCSRSMKRNHNADSSKAFTISASGQGSDANSQNESLQDICQRLEKVLRISKSNT